MQIVTILFGFEISFWLIFRDLIDGISKSTNVWKYEKNAFIKTSLSTDTLCMLLLSVANDNHNVKKACYFH